MIYLDHAATSPILPCAKQAMLECLDIFPGNPSALHTLGHLAKNQIETARKHIAALINASPEEIIFTSGGSEANNTIISTFRDQIIAHSPIEHPSILQPAAKYAKKNHHSSSKRCWHHRHRPFLPFRSMLHHACQQRDRHYRAHQRHYRR